MTRVKTEVYKRGIFEYDRHLLASEYPLNFRLLNYCALHYTTLACTLTNILSFFSYIITSFVQEDHVLN